MENNTSKVQPNTSYQKYIVLKNSAWKYVPEPSHDNNFSRQENRILPNYRRARYFVIFER